MNHKKTIEMFEYLKFLVAFQNIKRDIYAVGEDRMENDAEHSFQLAMMVWFVNSSENFRLNEEKILKYALVHDLVEVYAGDTPVFSSDIVLMESKTDREKEALKRIKANFKEFDQLMQQLDKYEQKSDPEACFVYVIDKMLPAMNICLDDFKTWKKESRKIQDWERYIENKLYFYPKLEAFYQRLRVFIHAKF